MRALVFLLVLVNLLFYAFSAGYFGRPDGPDAGRIEQQVAPERLHLVSRGEAPAAKVAATPAPPPVAAEPAVEAALESACLRWEHLVAADADRLASLLTEKFAVFRQSRREVAGEGSSWWVFIPPLPGKAEADKKAGELRLFGVTDYFIVPDSGPNRFAISLGVFSSEKGGQERLAELKQKGVRSARLAVRPGKDHQVVFEAVGPAGDKAVLQEAAARLLPKAAPRDCQ